MNWITIALGWARDRAKAAWARARQLTVPTMMLAVALPIGTVITLMALNSVSALPANKLSGVPHLMAYALELAPATLWVIAIFGGTAGIMRWTGMNLENGYRENLIKQVHEDGNGWAALVLAGETLAWVLWFRLLVLAFLEV